MVSNGTAGRRLGLLVGGVMLAAVGCLGWAVATLEWSVPLAYPLAFAALVAVAGSGTVFVWTRSQHQVTTTAGAILAAVVVLPTSWAIIATAAGVAVAKALRRQQSVKAAFNTSKEIVAAAVASATAHAAGLVPAAVAEGPLVGQWRGWLVALVAAALVYAVADEVLPVPVIALASGVPWRQVAARAWDMRTAARGVDVLVAGLTIAFAAFDLRLLVVIPAGMLVAYVTYTYRLRLAEERRAWQQLAAATDALAAASIDGDLTRVLHIATTHTGRLFPAAVAEVELDGRLVRGGPDGVTFDGPTDQAPPLPSSATTSALPTTSGQDPVVLRLRFSGDSRLAEREPHLLHTLAGAIATTVRIATTHATVAELAERSSHEAIHDPLTELPNRRYLSTYTSQLLQGARSGGIVALMLIDLDHFKDVNDAIGHSAGDRVLREAATRLRAADSNVLVARLGGDEFAVVFTSTNRNLATGRAEKILRSLREPMSLDGIPVGLDASAGVAFAADPTIGCEELLRRADVAMYRAKGSERPLRLAVYSQSHDRSETARLTLRAEVPRAAATGAWDLAYEPIVDLASGTVVGADARTRWHHLDLDQLPPARWLGILARAGQLHPFVASLLDRVLADAACWSARGFDVTVTVALTPQALAAPDLETVIRTALADHDLDPRRLTVELAHTTGVGHSPVEAHLSSLHTSGVRIALDGTGTSTLAALDLPVDALKVSGKFVAAADTSAKATALISAITELGRRFDLPVCAEGIERHQQRRTMWELGCTHGQGSLFGRPLTADALLATLLHGHITGPLHEDGTVIRLPSRAVGHS